MTIALANGTEFGLAAYFCGATSRIWRVAEAVAAFQSRIVQGLCA